MLKIKACIPSQVSQSSFHERQQRNVTARQTSIAAYLSLGTSHCSRKPFAPVVPSTQVLSLPTMMPIIKVMLGQVVHEQFKELAGAKG